jgi:hypothetical protein
MPSLRDRCCFYVNSKLPVGVLQWIVMVCVRAGVLGDGGGRVGLEEVPHAPGEVALEAADGLAASLALGLSACEVGGGLGVQASFDDGEAVEGAVELAIAAAVEAMALGAPRGGGDRR